MFDFSHYCDVGDYLINVPSEANIRSGISRYYYSGLCCVRRYLVETMNETEFILFVQEYHGLFLGRG